MGTGGLKAVPPFCCVPSQSHGPSHWASFVPPGIPISLYSSGAARGGAGQAAAAELEASELSSVTATLSLPVPETGQLRPWPWPPPPGEEVGRWLGSPRPGNFHSPLSSLPTRTATPSPVSVDEVRRRWGLNGSAGAQQALRKGGFAPRSTNMSPQEEGFFFSSESL